MIVCQPTRLQFTVIAKSLSVSSIPKFVVFLIYIMTVCFTVASVMEPAVATAAASAAGAGTTQPAMGGGAGPAGVTQMSQTGGSVAINVKA